jgi:hypothetical protein
LPWAANSTVAVRSYLLQSTTFSIDKLSRGDHCTICANLIAENC